MTYREPQPDAPLLVVSRQVVALDRATGKQLWRYDLKGVARRFAFDGPRVFVFESTGTIHCVEVATGRLIGRVETELRSANSMLVDGDRIYLTDDVQAVAMDFRGAIPGGNVIQPDFSRG